MIKRQPWKNACNKYAIRPIQKFAYTRRKSSTDTELIIDAMDLLHSKTVSGFCIYSSDSDYTGLVHRIREEGLFVMGIGKKSTPEAFVEACEEFIFTDDLANPINKVSTEKLKQMNIKNTTILRERTWRNEGLKQEEEDAESIISTNASERENLFLWNKKLNKAPRFDRMKIFNEMKANGIIPDIVSWNGLLCDTKTNIERKEIVNQMCANGVLPNEKTLNTFSNFCRTREEVEDISSFIFNNGNVDFSSISLHPRLDSLNIDIKSIFESSLQNKRRRNSITMESKIKQGTFFGQNENL